MRHLLILLSVLIFCSCSSSSTEQAGSSLSADITPADIQTHINYLAQDSLKGRQAGTPGEAVAARYIADHFRQFGLQPLGDDTTYYQQFTINMSVLNNPHRSDTTTFPDEDRIARNVVGMIEGSEQPETYIVIGAHYDHLGMGAFGSLYKRSDRQIHNGADDNASGTSGVLELAQYFSQNQPKKSILFIGFSGEEMGLLGSQYFVEHPVVPLDQIQAMINMDMIGRLGDKLMIFGTGTSGGWTNLIEQANTDSLTIETVPDGTGASDHTSFYNKKIPVLHYFTDTHADYHRPSDDAGYINAEGEDRVLEHLRRLVSAIDTTSGEQLAYTKAPVTQDRDVTMQGPTLGVTPDYGFDGTGMRITGVSAGGPAEAAGLQGGDVIIRVDGRSLKDIYDYMDILNTLEKGQQTTVTVQRDGSERTLDITL